MAANDRRVPVGTLAHAARLARDSRQLDQYGITVGDSQFDDGRLLNRVRQVVEQVQCHETLRPNLERAGVTVLEDVGVARFVDATTLECERGPRMEADRAILCMGGTNRRLPVPGFEFTATHSDAWALTTVPGSMLVIGVGAMGDAGGVGVQRTGIAGAVVRGRTPHSGHRRCRCSKAKAAVFPARGIVVAESFGRIDRFEKPAPACA
jgi:pyruvate/2-oxoglutarate dehydrogenase complex dihydrolipoamide dehydrogenase (E3) component